MSASDDFEGSNSKENTIEKIKMVGAVPGEMHGLSFIDNHLLSFFLQNLDRLKIPTGEDLEKFNSETNADTKAPVDIVNYLPEFGGRDFLLEQGNPDAVIMCNIPEGSAVNEDDWTTERILETPVALNLRQSFSVSEHHTPGNWKAKMAELSPKLIFISGGDSFDPSLFMDGRYICLKGPILVQGLLISKSFLKDIEISLRESNSPLVDCIGSQYDYFELTTQHEKQEFGRYSRPKAGTPKLIAIK